MKKIIKKALGIFKNKPKTQSKKTEEPINKGPLWEYRTNK